jgi:hypothetical protein
VFTVIYFCVSFRTMLATQGGRKTAVLLIPNITLFCQTLHPWMISLLRVFGDRICVLSIYCCIFRDHICLLSIYYWIFRDHICLLSIYYCIFRDHICLLFISYCIFWDHIFVYYSFITFYFEITFLCCSLVVRFWLLCIPSTRDLLMLLCRLTVSREGLESGTVQWERSL